MPSPTFAFGLLIATATGSFFHFLIKGDGRELPIYILSSWAGFALGQFFGDVFDAQFLSIGSIHALHGVIGSLALCLVTFYQVRVRSH